jgi:hypothetical protein
MGETRVSGKHADHDRTAIGRGGGEMLTMTSGEGASAFFSDVDRNVSPENPDPRKFIGIAESHGLRFPLPPR